MLRREPRAALVDKKGFSTRKASKAFMGPVRAQRQPPLQRHKRGPPHRHAAPLAAFAQHMGFGRVQVDPAARPGAGLHIQTHQLGNAQAAAIKQFGDAAVACFKVRVATGFGGLVAGQLHRLVHAQRLGQGLGGPGRAHVLRRVAAHQAFAAQPGVKAAPARQDQRNAAPAAASAVHLGHPAPQVGGVHVRQRHIGCASLSLQLLQVCRVQLHGALGQALFNAHMLQVALDQRVRIGWWVGQRRSGARCWRRQARHGGLVDVS